MKRFTFFIISIIAFVSTALCSDIKLLNAGIAFAGVQSGENNIVKRFPYSSFYAKYNDLNQYLAERISKFKKEGYSFVTEDLGSVRENTVSMAFVVDAEKHFISYIEGINQYKLEVFVAAEILLFDFRTKTILATYPFMVSCSDLFKTKPGEENIQAMYSNIFGKKSCVINGVNINIFDYFFQVLSQIEIKRSYSSTVGITTVDVHSTTESNLRSIGFPDNDSAKTFMVNVFSANLYKNFKTPLVPYSYENSEIFYAMATGYKEADKLSNDLILKTPKSTYKITLKLNTLDYKKEDGRRGINKCIFTGKYDILVHDIENEKLFGKRISSGKSIVLTDLNRDQEMFNTELFYTLILLNQNVAKRLSYESSFKIFKDIMEKCK